MPKSKLKLKNKGENEEQKDPYTVWAQYKTHAKEPVDSTASADEARYLLAEYRMAFGSDFTLWIDPRVEY